MTPRKRNKVEAKETMLLVCAKESEAVFFSQMRKDCRYSNLTVIAEECSSLEKFIDAAVKERNRGKYSVCWALFGFNDVATDVEEVKSMMDYADKKKVNLCYFNPTFDLYFMLFATKPRAFISDSEMIKNRVQSAFDGYDGSVEYFLTKGLNLNFRIYPQLAEADKNARDYNNISEIDVGIVATTLPLFFDSLKSVCGKADMSHNLKNRK